MPWRLSEDCVSDLGRQMVLSATRIGSGGEMGLLPEHANDFSSYMRETKGTPYAPYNPPVVTQFNRAMLLVTLFPLLGILLPITVENGIIDILSYIMLGACPLLGIPALALATGADKAHSKNEIEETRTKAKTARLLSAVGLALGTVVTTAAIAVAFVSFLSGEGAGYDTIPTEQVAAEAAAAATEGAPAEGAAPAGDAKAADAKPATDKKDK